MTLATALELTLDYSKFVATLWNYYILAMVAFLGWIVSLRTKDATFDLPLRLILVSAVIVVAVAFAAVIHHKNSKLVNLMSMVRELALRDIAADPGLEKSYATILDVEHNARFLKRTVQIFLPVDALAICCLTWFLTGPKASDQVETAKS